ncbi:MAG: hypothetical protein ABH824_02495 [Nanoarchaeota archaeon]|nr:hypothetical protein [Nanoarchaeota archaeon]MBU1632450.1 hypothetical protein [Nanoarchaeota archaeon]MBU1876332.1 hypothetical protein [Nanoarchaeota archaeon]
MEKKIFFRAVIEVLGKPKEHVESSIKEYVSKIKEDERYEVVNEELTEAKKQEDTDLWATFTELEIWTGKMDNLIDFCFDYMPSLIDIIEPSQLSLSDNEVSSFINDLQAKLHGVDMVAKQLKIENDTLKTNTAFLLKNYVTVLLGKSNLTSEQISKLTGVNKDLLEDFLDKLIDQNVIDLKDGIYYLKSKK